MVDTQRHQCHCDVQPLPLDLVAAVARHGQHVESAIARYRNPVVDVAHEDLGGRRHLVISDTLIARNWTLRDFADWMSEQGFEVGRDYRWCWHDQWAVCFQDANAMLLVAMKLE